ncbi:MAG TPA: leucyl aminopeptidase [Steroidobacteraceae bacterium]|nr:leucyl aminopeptidase [Steroidobacteraceae bacterium]
MQFQTWKNKVTDVAADCLIIGSYEDGALTPHAASVDAASGERLSRLIKRGDFNGKLAMTFMLPEPDGVKAPRVLVVGLGPKAGYSRKAWRKAVAAAMLHAGRTQSKSVALALPRPTARELDDQVFGRVVAELAGAALYKINDLKTAKKPKPPQLDTILLESAKAAASKKIHAGFDEGVALAAGAVAMRNLANLPGNVCTPSYLAKQAEALAKRYKSITTKVLGLEEIKREKMGCFLAVTQGSDEPPRFIVMQHKHPRAKKAPLVLVGKGITFDTGGISLKDPPTMDEMKFDMSGAAAVMGAFTTLGELNLPLNVVGLIPTCENMPSGRAIKPGDIVTSASGQTVEILNTDAEGRLILCDALHYARRFEPAAVIDLATLTGAIVVALGTHHTGVFSNDDALAHDLVKSGVRADDRAWHMPLTEEYGEQLKSNFADFANVAGRDGGSITAAAFLGKFTKDLKWAHMDIAGTAYAGGNNKGSTGRPIALLTDFLVRRAAR